MIFKVSRVYVAALCLWVGLLAWGAAGCSPDYPNCKGDEDCASRGEVCAPNGRCTECAGPMDCGGDCGVCKEGKCVRAKGCCEQDGDCAKGDRPYCSKTPRDEQQQRQCVACLRDSHCPVQGQICEMGACVQPTCDLNNPCADFQVCVKDRCQPMRLCELQEVFFHTDSHAIPDDQRPKLTRNKACFDRYREATGDRVVLKLSGHADERGQDDYNLGLSQRRAQEVQRAMQALGLPASKVLIRAAGSREPLVPGATSAKGHQWNRRVDFDLR
jgi:outer membrane protein OmpA-like peptidoglycan-associated protein